MLSMAIQPGVNSAYAHSFTQKFGFKPFKALIFVSPNASSLCISKDIEFKNRLSKREARLSTSAAAAEAFVEEVFTHDSTSPTPQESQPIEGKEERPFVIALRNLTWTRANVKNNLIFIKNARRRRTRLAKDLNRGKLDWNATGKDLCSHEIPMEN
ncbi:hypothetical protein HHK36_028597 [Tetracentron sinense]|uniref:Uncharacterized protein n=1 Tax=Tetracentron sinense TaxID=13715 RepID=A0A835D3L2_TETSI|nr:hypothetical protein HHK36_028597 [Tetracentron sinense]